MALALFDLDRTLIDCNSGRLWVAHEWREGKLTVGEAAKGLYWLLLYSLGRHDLDHAFEAAVAKLEGEEEALIRARTETWFAEEVVHRLRPGALAALDAHRERGDTLVIATTSSPYAGGAAARAFGLEHVISSRFEVADGRFTGRVAQSCLGDGKAHAVEAWAAEHGFDLDEASFYTDSVSDRLLLERVGRPVAVHPDRELARLASARGWEIAEWGKSA
ncbi:MAG: HAD-IB family hydrolase [Deltaproteobacteria bacterium]|nr:MAG: HAD-IB family hydrolase [Deltaproteobacteria bacterium]